MNYADIGTFLRILREQRNISQEAAAAVIGISDRTLRNIESGVTRAEIETLFKLCDLYSISGEELWFFYEQNTDMQEELKLYE